MYKVSVIVPIFNCEENLNRCLNSIRNQTYMNLEVILIDNGSTDNSRQIAKGYAQFDKRFKLYSMNNKKFYEVINYAMLNLTGKYILYVDSNSSWLDNNMIKLMVENQEKFKSDVIQIDSYDLYFDKLLYDDRYNKEDGEGLILDNKYFREELKLNKRVKNVIWEKLYRKDLIEKILLENNDELNQHQLLYNIGDIIDRYIILHKPMIYNIKEQ